METYLFRDKYFAISEEGLHLLRNGFNFQTINMSDIESIRIGKGKSIKNWLVLLILGIGIIAGALYYGRNIWNFLITPEAPGNIYMEEIAAVFIGVFLGGYCVFLALKVEEVIEFITSKKSESFSTKSLKKEGIFDDMLSFLKQKKSVLEE